MVSKALEGVFRSLRIYHGVPNRAEAMDKLYSRFLQSGDLAFDIGSHVGDRVSSFRRLGATVVALEPQPLAHRAIRLIHGRDPGVHVLQAACGAQEGQLSLHINTANPTVSTASQAFTDAADGACGWQDQVWDQVVEVPCVTLDKLITQYGRPDFVKIDVEGFEAAVLDGLSMALPALSFEFTTIQRDVAAACLRRLASLGKYRFNLALGESQTFEFLEPCNQLEIERCLAELPHSANSGDVYAVLD